MIPRRRSRSERAAAAVGAETEGVVPMEAMGEAYSRLANSRSVGGAVRAAARSAPGPAAILNGTRPNTQAFKDSDIICKQLRAHHCCVTTLDPGCALV